MHGYARLEALKRAILFETVGLRYAAGGRLLTPSWHGTSCERQADAEIRKLLVEQRPRGWVWNLGIRVVFEGGESIQTTLVLGAEPSWRDVRRALAVHFEQKAADPDGRMDDRREAHRILQLLCGEKRPAPVEETHWERVKEGPYYTWTRTARSAATQDADGTRRAGCQT